MKKLLLLAIVVLGISTVSFGQVAASATLGTNDASATIIAPIILTNPIKLSFGTIGAQEAASTVVLEFSGSRSASTAALFAGSSPASAASFHVTGSPSATFVITLPDENTPVAGTGLAVGAPPMTITGWTSSVGTSTALEAGGSKDFQLKGVLNVGTSAVQTPGIYKGTYSVTVAYN